MRLTGQATQHYSTEGSDYLTAQVQLDIGNILVKASCNYDVVHVYCCSDASVHMRMLYHSHN
jgi:hypothetical protein